MIRTKENRIESFMLIIASQTTITYFQKCIFAHEKNDIKSNNAILIIENRAYMIRFTEERETVLEQKTKTKNKMTSTRMSGME